MIIMENIKTVAKFEIDSKVLYVKTLWKPNTNDLFHIKIYDGDKSWSGNFSNEAVQTYKENFEESEDEYYNNAKKGLTGDHEFSYSFDLVDDDSKTATFKWKKKFEDLDAEVDHGAVLLHRDEVTESKDVLLDDLLSENRTLKESIDKLNDRNKEISLDLDRCKNSLNELKDMKTSLETSLYGKFVQVLTAKKRRIQLLEDNINTLSRWHQAVNEVD